MHVSKGMISSESSFTLILFRLGFETFTGDCCSIFATSMGDNTVVEDIVDNFLRWFLVGISKYKPVINHMTCYKFECSHRWKFCFHKKKSIA